MSQKIYQVDAFTNEPFKGNPAAVCLLPQPRSEAWMQNVAREMNLSETAFLLREGDDFRLRWFTPAAEVDLCGHATLASAHVLWSTQGVGKEEVIRFHTRSGLLRASLKGDWIELDFPVKPAQPLAPPAGLAQAIGITPLYVGASQFDYLVEAADEKTVRAMKPDFNQLAALPVRGVIVTSSASTPGYDFVSRFFAPAVGVNEDPVTGSAHCTLAPFWSNRLNKTEMLAYQASPRGGVVKVRLAEERVLLSGQAVIILHGELFYDH